MGLPALDAEKYVERDNWLGVALAALMRVSKERKIELAGRALERIVNSAENAYRKTLLYDCVNTYLPVDEEEWRRFDDMIRNHPDSGVKAMQLSVYDYVERRGRLEGLEEGKLEGKLEGQRELVQKQLELASGRCHRRPLRSSTR